MSEFLFIKEGTKDASAVVEWWNHRSLAQERNGECVP